MMEAFARLVVRPSVAWSIVCVTLLATVLAGWQALRVDQDDDVLKFLPRGNADIAHFHEINERFGGLDVALVGIEVEDPFDPAFLAKLRTLTKTLNEEPGIAYALSLANVEDFTLEKGGARVDYLVDELPRDDASKLALRAKVMSRDHIVGNLISKDGRSVLLYHFGKHGTSPRQLSATVKSRVTEVFPELPKYWGGAPFASTYIYDVTQADMRRLTPWAILVKLIIVLLVFRSVIGVFLTVASAGIGIVLVGGLMGLSHTPANVVLGSLPVILFALGSAYATHVLVEYFSERQQHSAPEAVVATLRNVGPSVLAAGLITAAGLFSFCVMDIQPLREFGLFAGLGILMALSLSLTFVPAMLVLTRAPGRSVGAEGGRRFLAGFAGAMAKRGRVVTVALAVLAIFGCVLSARLEARMEASAFFAKNSPPDQAERFLRERFGGSQFIQLAVDGDMNDADVLREVQRLADEVGILPHVTSVTHIGQVLALSSDAMVGERRIPATTDQVLALYRFLAGRPSVRQLVAEEVTPAGAVRGHAVILVKIDTDDHAAVGVLLAQIEQLAAHDVVLSYRFLGRNGLLSSDDEVARKARIHAVVTASVRKTLHDFALTVPAREAFLAAFAKPGTQLNVQAVEGRLVKLLVGSSDAELSQVAAPLAKAVVAFGPNPTEDQLIFAIAEATKQAADSDEIEDTTDSLRGVLEQAWRPELQGGGARTFLQTLEVVVPEGETGERLVQRVQEALRDLKNPSALVAATGAEAVGSLKYTVSGTPVLNRGLSMSVFANQWKSLLLSFGLVLLIMSVLYRSLTAGLLGLAPTALTLLVIYGAMSVLGLHLEVGTSMLASLIIGAGVDYGVHLLAGWRAEPGESLDVAAQRALRHSGVASFSNAVMVSAGFFVLTLGEARPLKTVGGLTGAAMLVAALATCVVIPALARRRHYGRRPDAVPQAETPR